MNNQINRISSTMTENTVADLKNLLKQILGLMPFLIGLTTDERSTLPKIGEANKAFVRDCINSMINNADMLPSFVNPAEILKDFTLFEQLDELELLMLQTMEKIQDTRILAGSEAYSGCLSAYHIFETASAAGVPGSDALFNTLKQRFAAQGGNGGNLPTPPQS